MENKDEFDEQESHDSPARGLLIAGAVSVMLWLAVYLIVYALVVK